MLNLKTPNNNKLERYGELIHNSMNKYKISLIIPCYNIENTLFEEKNLFKLAMESVINQTIGIENIEVLLVDDCSTDNTPHILKRLQEKYSNIKPIFLEKNSGGPSIPRNIGIKNATADYISFLDQDDRLNLECMETLYNEMINNDVDMVKCNYSLLMNNDILNYDSGKNEYLSIEPKNKDLIYLPGFVWGFLFNKEFILKNNIQFPNMHGEDSLFLANCINNTNKNIISLNNYYGVIYTVNNLNSITHSFTNEQMNNCIETYSSALDSYIKNKQHPDFIKLALEHFIVLFIGLLLRSNESSSNKKLKVKKIKSFLVKYNNIDVELPKHYAISKKLILGNHYYIINLMSTFIIHTFEQKWFIKLFRNRGFKN